jgi:hypothetical protein
MADSIHDQYVKRTFSFDVAAHKAGRHAAKPSLDQRLARAEDNIRGTTKSIIGVVGAQLLQKQYDDMLTGLERARAARLADIDGWTPDQTPLGGELLIKICTGLAGVAKAAFPEVAFLEIAGKGLGAVVKGKELLERGVEPSKQELDAVKNAAREELKILIDEARTQCANREDLFQHQIEAAVEKLSPDEIDALQGMNQPKLIGNFVRDRLGIARGEYHTPGVVGALEVRLMADFNAWVKADFKRRKTGKSSHDVASEGGHSWEAMSLAELYRLAEANDREGLQSALRDLNARRDRKTPPIPEGWYEAQLKKLRETIQSDFDQKFALDINRLIPARA